MVSAFLTADLGSFLYLAGLSIRPSNTLQRADAQGFSLQLRPMDVEDVKVWTMSRQVRIGLVVKDHKER